MDSIELGPRRMICPHCGKKFQDPDKITAGRARWAGTTPRERAKAARKAAKSYWQTQDADARKLHAQRAAAARWGKRD